MSSLRPPETLMNAHHGSNSWYEFSHDGKLLVTAGMREDYSADIRIWDVERESLVGTIAADRNLQYPVTRMAFSSDDKKVAIALPGDVQNAEKIVIVRDLESGKEHTYQTSGPEFIDLEFSNDSEQLRAYSAKAVVTWDLHTRMSQQSPYPGERSLPDYHPPGYPQFRQSQGRSWQWTRQTSDSSLLAYTHGSQIRVVARASGEVRTFDEHPSFVRSIDLAPDGSRLVSGGEDNTIRVWDLKCGQPPVVLRTSLLPWAVALSPDGTTLASAHFNGLITLWDLRMNAEILTIDAHALKIDVLRFSPDGQVLASGGWDGLVRLWKAPRLD